jgi:hypothetical protein
MTQDYLAGNFYPSYLALSGNYANRKQGFAWIILVKDGMFVVNCGNESIANTLNKIAETVKC